MNIMNRSKMRISPRVESLEQIALLSTMTGMPVVAAAPTGLGSTGTVSTSDVQGIQQDASGGFLEQYISQIEALYGQRNNVKQFARAVIADHQVTNFDLERTAGAAGVTLSTGIASPSDLRNAQEVLAAIRGGNVDRAYLRAMAQINAQDVAADQQLINSTQDAGIRAYAQETLAYDQNHLQGATQLSLRPRSTYSPSLPTTSITAPPAGVPSTTAADAQALRRYSSGGYLEQFISQIEEQRGVRSDAQQYAQSVVGDHQVTNYDLLTTSNAAGVALPSGITEASDIQDARQVLYAVRHGYLDRTYLRIMARINAQNVANDQQLIGSTQDAGIRAFAQQSLASDTMHLQGAQQLLSRRSTTYTPGR